MSTLISLDQLWNSIPEAGSNQAFASDLLSELPPGTRRYLTHAIAPGTLLASAVRLKMHGEININGWHPFTAEQIIQRGRGMIWEASARVYGMKVSGSDRLLDGQGQMQWKLFGLMPLVNAIGPDITRSATGRVNIESVWLPSLLCRNDVQWTASSETLVQAEMHVNPETTVVNFEIGQLGELKQVSTLRWGNPDKAGYRFVSFGAYVEEERTFAGFTIPSRLRVGWFFGAERFKAAGEFFRVTIDDAIYR